MAYVDTMVGPAVSSGDSRGNAKEQNASRERVSLRIPSGVFGRLEELREITHASNVNEVVKNALLFYDALVRERVNGSDIYVISKDGEKTKYPVFL